MTWSWHAARTPRPGRSRCVDAALEPPGDAGEHVLLAPAEHRQLVVAGRAARPPGPTSSPPGSTSVIRSSSLCTAVRSMTVSTRQAGDEADHAELVEVLELARVVGEQALGDQLQQDVVVALEGGEDVGVGLERGEPVRREVAGAAARLAALLDGPGRVPGAERLGAGGQRLQLRRGARRRRRWPEKTVVQLRRPAAPARSAARRSRASSGQQPPLVHAVVEQQLPPRRVRRRRTGGAGRRSGWRSSSATLAALIAGAADADAALDQRAEHREEAPVGVLDRGCRSAPSAVTSA